MARFAVDTRALDPCLINIFLSHMTEWLNQAFPALRELDWDKLEEIGHSLKGMGGSCGAPEVSVIGEVLELAARARNHSMCESLTNALGRWLDSAMSSQPPPPTS